MFVYKGIYYSGGTSRGKDSYEGEVANNICDLKPELYLSDNAARDFGLFIGAFFSRLCSFSA